MCNRDAARVRCQATGKRGRRRTRAPGSKDPPSENAVLALASVADVRRVACRGALEGLHARLVPGRAVDAVSGVVGGGRSSVLGAASEPGEREQPSERGIPSEPVDGARGVSDVALPWVGVKVRCIISMTVGWRALGLFV